MKVLTTYDLLRHRWSEPLGIGLGGFISYERLVEQLRRAGEILENETVTSLEFSEQGITYRLK